VKQTAYLRDKSIDAVESRQCGLEKFLLFFLQSLKTIQSWTDRSLKLAQVTLSLFLISIENFREAVNLQLLINAKLVQGIFQVIDNVGVCLLFQDRFFIIRLKRLANVFRGIDEVQDECIYLPPHRTV